MFVEVKSLQLPVKCSEVGKQELELASPFPCYALICECQVKENPDRKKNSIGATYKTTKAEIMASVMGSYKYAP